MAICIKLQRTPISTFDNAVATFSYDPLSAGDGRLCSAVRSESSVSCVQSWLVYCHSLFNCLCDGNLLYCLICYKTL